MGPNMELLNSKQIEVIFGIFNRMAAALSGSSSLPYILAEAMVNHKKMVHPPCIL
jgi:hypothetical protein